MINDYTHLTEIAGSKVSREQLQRMYTRYAFAAEHCVGKDVLEVGCGVGQGLGLLARSANKVIAGDYTDSLVQIAKSHYGDRVDIKQFDAQAMPFEDNSFDVIIMYEAIYYVPEPEKFLNECRRVLRHGGKVIICNANKEWSGFARSPHSYNYYSATELNSFLGEKGFKAKLFGDCPVSSGTIKSKITNAIRFVVVKLDLMPKNMKAKEKFKRLFFGKLMDMSPELKLGDVKYERPKPISPLHRNNNYKVVFAVGELNK